MSDSHEPPIIEALASSTADEQLWAMVAHLSYLLTYVMGLSFLAPLIIWLLQKEKSPFVVDQAKEALNFQLAALLVNAILGVATFFTCGVSLILVPVVLVGATVYSIIAGIAANRGEAYRYPYTIRFIS